MRIGASSRRTSRCTQLRSVVLLTISFSPMAMAAAGKCTLRKVAEFPITMNGPRAQTTAKINGQDVQLTVDSGAFYSMISSASAAALGLKLSPMPIGFAIRGMGGGRADVMYSSIKTLTLAGADLHNISFLVGGTEIGAGSVGLLGRNILHLADVEYDLAHGFIRLFEPKDCAQTPLSYWTGSYSEVAVFIRSDFPQSTMGSLISQSKAPWMYTNFSTALVNGKEYHAMLDTGAPVSFLSLSAAAKAGIKPDSPGVVYAGDSFGVGKTLFRSYIARFDSFKIGQEEVKNAKLRIGDIELPGIDMILGADFALSHRIYMANSQHKMYFTYNGGPVFDLSIKLKHTSQPGQQSDATGPAAGPDESADGSAATAANSKEEATPASAASDAEEAADNARRGEAFESRRDFDQALAALRRACALAPDNAEYAYRRGRVREELQQLVPAMTDFDRSLLLRPNDLNTLLARAELKIRMGDKPGARADLDAADAIAPKQANERFRMALAYEHADQFNVAIDQMNLWINSHGEDAQLPAMLNERCWIRGLGGMDLPRALKDCNLAIRLTDRSSYLYGRVADSRGLILMRMGNFTKSMADYNTAVKLRSKDAWAWYGRGIDKLRNGKTQEGNADIEQAIALWPHVAEEYKRFGIISDVANP
jgi:tetratricopeptide (TPR) repeat protein